MRKGMKKKGFTLVELIIVVAVLGILAAISVPKFGNIQRKAKIKSDIASAKSIASVAASMAADGTLTEDYTTDNVELVASNEIADQMQSTPKPQLDSDYSFYVGIDADGNVTVYASAGTNNSDSQVYPKPTDSTANPYYPDGTEDAGGTES
jgi:type IV pilus assembly protein PilA